MRTIHASSETEPNHTCLDPAASKKQTLSSNLWKYESFLPSRLQLAQEAETDERTVTEGEQRQEHRFRQPQETEATRKPNDVFLLMACLSSPSSLFYKSKLDLTCLKTGHHCRFRAGKNQNRFKQIEFLKPGELLITKTWVLRRRESCSSKTKKKKST